MRLVTSVLATSQFTSCPDQHSNSSQLKLSKNVLAVTTPRLVGVCTFMILPLGRKLFEYWLSSVVASATAYDHHSHVTCVGSTHRSVAGAADRGDSGRERRGSEAVGDLAVHRQVPGRQHREVHGPLGGEGHPGWPGGRGTADGAPLGQGPLHR